MLDVCYVYITPNTIAAHHTRSMLSYYNPTAPPSQPQLAAKKSKAKGTPLPCFIPVALYEAIRISCIYMALDNNPSNPLNAHAEPMTRSFNGNTVCMYAQDLLKQWLRFLCTNPLWSQTVIVDKVTKSKRGHLMQTTTTRVNATCVVMPSTADIRSVAGDNVQLGSELTFIATQLQNCLLRPGSNDQLLQPSQVPLGMIANYKSVTTPVNVVKQERLHRLGYGKIALKGADTMLWDAYYRSEAARLKYVLSNVLGVSVNDAAINSLTNEEAELHNSMLISSMIEASQGGQEYMQHGDYLNKASEGVAVNPSLVAYQRVAATAKVTRTDNPDARAYQDMINEYHRITGFRLDSKVEKAQKTLTFRLQEIEWARGLMASNPWCSVGYNQTTGRMYPISQQPFVAPGTVTADTQTSHVPVVAPVVAPRQQLQPQPQVQPLAPRHMLYGNPPTQSKPQVSPSDVQKHMATAPAYVPAAAIRPIAAAPAYPAMPPVQPMQPVSNAPAYVPAQQRAPMPTFAIPKISKDANADSGSNADDVGDVDDVIYPDADGDANVDNADDVVYPQDDSTQVQ